MLVDDLRTIAGGGSSGSGARCGPDRLGGSGARGSGAEKKKMLRVQVNADEITLKSLERRSSVLVNGAIKRQIK